MVLIYFWNWGIEASFSSFTSFCKSITWVLSAAISLDWIGVCVAGPLEALFAAELNREDCLSRASFIVIPSRNAIFIILFISRYAGQV
ncbi:Uncharacterized protein APZ42_010234 [Daphnia magna]|uniref:Uncharacterized protein n=1 Tax=Daphnia magna TaxID=35525 RepID=A0A164DHP6_9CRUS|nr:Uncharacterized protein APZ42_010234 [Daphnia magna]